MDIQELEILIFEQAHRNAESHRARCVQRLRLANDELEMAVMNAASANSALNRARAQYLSRVDNPHGHGMRGKV